MIRAALALATALGVAACQAPATAPVASAPLSGNILHARLVDGTWQIFDHDLATGASRQLTRGPGDKRYPVRAPSGDVIAHTSNQRPVLIDAATGAEREFLRELEPLRDVVVSPDGGRIVFSRIRTDLIDASNLWACDPNGARLRTLTDEPGIQCHPVWSRDGSRLAYVVGQGYGTYEIWSASPDGTDRRRLTENNAHEFFPEFSPDGAHIAFSSDRTGDYELWSMRADGTDARQLTSSPGLDSRPSWSPDGERLAFTTNRRGVVEIWALDVESGAVSQLLSAEEGVCDPSWY